MVTVTDRRQLGNRAGTRREVTLTITGAEARTPIFANGPVTYTPHWVSIELRRNTKADQWHVRHRQTVLEGPELGHKVTDAPNTVTEWVRAELAPEPEWLAGLLAEEEARR